MSGLSCHVAPRRQAAGLSVTALAARIGISRQALTAIEAGRVSPSTAIALRLASALDCSVEALFSLATPTLALHRAVGSAVGRAAVGRVGGHWVAHTLGLQSSAPADGLFVGGGVQPLVAPQQLEHNVLVAGCAPVLGTLSARIGPGHASWLQAGSGTALTWLTQGLVHIAGLHLAHADAPGTHDRIVRSALPGADVDVVSLVGWRQGLALAPKNPLGITTVGDLARPGLRVAQRQSGAGAQLLLERHAAALGILPRGPLLASHGEAAQALRFGAVDVAVIIEPVAQAFALPFLPLSEERFELAVPSAWRDHAGVRRFFDQLTSGAFAQEVAGMGAYELSDLGALRTVRAA